MIHAVSLRESALLYLIVGRLHLARSRERDVSSLHRRDISTPYFAREWHEHIDFAVHRVEAVGVNRKYCRCCEEIRTYYLRRPVGSGRWYARKFRRLRPVRFVDFHLVF